MFSNINLYCFFSGNFTACSYCSLLQTMPAYIGSGSVATSSLHPINLYGSWNWGSKEKYGWNFTDGMAKMKSPASLHSPAMLECHVQDTLLCAGYSCPQQTWDGFQDHLGATWHFWGVGRPLSSYTVSPWDKAGALGQLLHNYVCLKAWI